MRLFLAMLSHETNTFSNVPTNRAQFEARHLHYGGEIVEVFRETGTCLGGMIEAAQRHGATLVPSVAASASPAGRVTRDIYEHVKGRMLADLDAAGRLDGILLDLHGAMVPEGLDDGEGDIISAVRRAVGRVCMDRLPARSCGSRNRTCVLLCALVGVAVGFRWCALACKAAAARGVACH